MLAMCDQSSGDMPRKIDVMVPRMPLAAVALMRSRMSGSALKNRADEAAEVVGEPAEILAGACGESGGGGAVHLVRLLIEVPRAPKYQDTARFTKKKTCATMSA